MTDPTKHNVDIPRYLRYKAEAKQAEGYWDEKLERANSILHERVIRMHRDKLCTGCARFDWLRTHFYMLETIWYQIFVHARDNLVPHLWEQERKPVCSSDYDRVRLRKVFQNLSCSEDDVAWQLFTTLNEVQKDVEPLADHPRFEWAIDPRVKLSCHLCNALREASIKSRSPPLSAAPLPSQFTVTLSAGPTYQPEENHSCFDVSRSQLFLHCDLRLLPPI